MYLLTDQRRFTAYGHGHTAVLSARLQAKNGKFAIFTGKDNAIYQPFQFFLYGFRGKAQSCLLIVVIVCGHVLAPFCHTAGSLFAGHQPFPLGIAFFDFRFFGGVFFGNALTFCRVSLHFRLIHLKFQAL